MSPHGDPDAQFEVYRQLAELGQPQLNHIEALLAAQDKVRTTFLLAQAGVPTPSTVVTQSANEALAALETFSCAVLKPRFGSLGRGMRRLRWGARGRAALLRALEDDGVVYLQRYVETGGQDYRVFVVGGRVRGAILRRARSHEWRTNMSRGGSVEPIEPPVALARAAVAAARAVGLAYTGVDLVIGPQGPQVLEVNGHPNFEGIFRSGGVDVGAHIVDLVLRRARAYQREPGERRVGGMPTRESWAAMAPSA
jgi:ribosomal protein S6--L-glutamate ligase